MGSRLRDFTTFRVGGVSVKRDMDLIKAILLELEKTTPGTFYGTENFEIEGFSSEQVHFHLY